MRRFSSDGAEQKRGSWKSGKHDLALELQQAQLQLQRLHEKHEADECQSRRLLRNLEAELEDAEETIAVTKDSLAKLLEEKASDEHRHALELEQERKIASMFRESLIVAQQENELLKLLRVGETTSSIEFGTVCQCGGRPNECDDVHVLVAPPPQDALHASIADEEAEARLTTVTLCARLAELESRLQDRERELEQLKSQTWASNSSTSAVPAEQQIHTTQSQRDHIEQVALPQFSDVEDRNLVVGHSPICVEQMQQCANGNELSCTANSPAATVAIAASNEGRRQTMSGDLQHQCLNSFYDDEPKADVPFFDLACGEYLWEIEDDYAEKWNYVKDIPLPVEKDTQFHRLLAQGLDCTGELHQSLAECSDRLIARSLLLLCYENSECNRHATA